MVHSILDSAMQHHCCLSVVEYLAIVTIPDQNAYKTVKNGAVNGHSLSVQE